MDLEERIVSDITHRNEHIDWAQAAKNTNYGPKTLQNQRMDAFPK